MAGFPTNPRAAGGAAASLLTFKPHCGAGGLGLSGGASAKPGSERARHPDAGTSSPQRPGVRRSPAPRTITHQEGARQRTARGPPRRAHLPSPGPGVLPSPRHQRRRVPGRPLPALLRTCVPPAATQDTRGRSSARVPCCSPRSHTVSWRAWPAGPCPASSSRWAAWLPLSQSDVPCTGTSKLENRGRHRDWAPGPGLGPRQQGESHGLGAGQPGAASTEPRPGQRGRCALPVSPRACWKRSESLRAHRYLAAHRSFPSKNGLRLFPRH